MIGLLDSGLGGVTVLREIIRQGIKAKYIYYCDDINNPYGDKSDDEVYTIVKNIVDFLLNRGCLAIVIACNTASAICVKRLREEYSDTIFIAIEPAYKMVYDYNRDAKTLVMATNGTLNSDKFLNLYSKYNNQNTILLPCSGFADIIEEGNLEKVDKYLVDKLSKYKNVENVVLGCTHYPLIKDNIKKVLGNVKFFDGASGVSRELLRQLNKRNIICSSDISFEFINTSSDTDKRVRFYELLKQGV